MDIKKLKTDIWKDGWIVGWIDRDLSILQLEFNLHQRHLTKTRIKQDVIGSQNDVVGLQSHKSGMR